MSGNPSQQLFSTRASDWSRTATHLEQLRLAELESALAWIRPSQSILEIGAGAGWQARELSQRNHHVEAVDLPASSYAQQRVWKIRDYDGVHLPFADGAFDVVYTSHVLAHVANLHDLLAHAVRVTRPGDTYMYT
jgi:ubiquinone/menaquinone biosynthesis C-methylase UbiE